jgi:membrane protein CcdC involved in cytochrome C biogenesis
MRETQLSARQIQAVVLATVALMGGMLAYVFTVLPSTADPAGSRRDALAAGIIAGLAAVWFAKLMIDAISDRRRGIERGPAKVTGRFGICFGAAVALGGITCSALTYWSAAAAGGGIWTLYYGMVLWGGIQMLIGYRKLRHSRSVARSPSPEAG